MERLDGKLSISFSFCTLRVVCDVQFHERLCLSFQDERLMAEKLLFSLPNTALMRRRCKLLSSFVFDY